jgi:hypothetical protein
MTVMKGLIATLGAALPFLSAGTKKMKAMFEGL